jgi:hypothetical protein
MVRRSFLALVLVFGSVVYAEPAKDLRISAVRAYAFLPQTGAIDPRDLVTTRSLVLRDIPFNAHEFGSPSPITLVIVELAGSDDVERRARLVLRAVSDEIERSRTELALDFSWEGSSVKVPFLVYDTGCAELWLSAELLRDGKEVQFQTARVPFTCEGD